MLAKNEQRKRFMAIGYSWRSRLILFERADSHLQPDSIVCEMPFDNAPRSAHANRRLVNASEGPLTTQTWPGRAREMCLPL